MISLLFSYYFPSCSLLFPYFFPMCFLFCSITYLLFPSYFPIFALLFPYNFLILHYYCPICLPAFQNDNLRHLEWLCFDGHAKCLKPAKIHTHIQIDLQHFCSLEKVVPTVSTKYNREQLGKYTGKLITTDPGIRVWYGGLPGRLQKPARWCPLDS